MKILQLFRAGILINDTNHSCLRQPPSKGLHAFTKIIISQGGLHLVATMLFQARDKIKKADRTGDKYTQSLLLGHQPQFIPHPLLLSLPTRLTLQQLLQTGTVTVHVEHYVPSLLLNPYSEVVSDLYWEARSVQTLHLLQQRTLQSHRLLPQRHLCGVWV